MPVISLARGAPIACALAFAFTVSAASTTSAQVTDRGRITGRVRDSSGGVLPGTQITLTTDNASRTVISNTEGDFAFDGVAPGAVHTIQAQLQGFTSVTREGLVVLPGETTTINLSLKVGCLTDPIVNYGMYSPLDELLSAEFVAHVRVAEESYRVEIGTSGDCPRHAHYASAAILQLATPSREWRPGMTIDVYSDHGPRAGSEYIAFLRFDDILQRYKLGEPSYAIPVVEGRVEWSWERAFGFRDGAPVSNALARIGEMHARHTEYRPLGAEGAEAPLEALRYKTGWFLMGGLRVNRDEWLDIWNEPVGPPIERPFDFVGDRRSTRQLPRRDDRIRLTTGGVITLVNFRSVGEALRDRPPTRWNTEASLANVTGTRVDAGRVYDVGDVFFESINGRVRFVWVRLVAVQNDK